MEHNGRKVKKVLSGDQWKPEKGESKDLLVLSVDVKESKRDDRENEVVKFNVYSCIDIKTNDFVAVIPGALIDHFYNKRDFSIGDVLYLEYQGTMDLKDGNRANQWRCYVLDKEDLENTGALDTVKDYLTIPPPLIPDAVENRRPHDDDSPPIAEPDETGF